MEVINNCPICGCQNQNEFLICKDFTLSLKNFSIAQCKDCEFKFTNPRPQKSELGNYYKSENYISHSNTKKGIVNFLYQLVRRYTLRKKLALINGLGPKGRILDIGCGTGEFLKVCQNDGWNISGIEPNSDARSLAQKNHDLHIDDESEIKKFNESIFDIITMWHVLEHVPDLNERVEDLYKLLKKSGYAIIAVPNASAADAAIYGKFWAAYDVPRHLYHFSEKTILALFEKHQMECVKILPMIFDSYYVSILSEKYKTGTTNLIKGFINGFNSNFSSKKHGYSSQIYIFKKKM